MQESKEQNDDLVSKVSSMSRLSTFELKRSSHSMLSKNPIIFTENLQNVKAMHEFLGTSPNAKASVPSLQNPTTHRPVARA